MLGEAQVLSMLGTDLSHDAVEEIGFRSLDRSKGRVQQAISVKQS